MLNFGAGKWSHPNLYAGSNVNKANATSDSRDAYIESFEAAIDGPPSPEGIRAYTQQMKRNLMSASASGTGGSWRPDSASSATPYSAPPEPAYTVLDGVSLSRKSSGRSNTSNMPQVRPERPASSQGFGSIFSRGGRKRRVTNVDALRTSNSTSNLGDLASDDKPKEPYHGGKNGHRRRHFISEPYNFQHVTHTHQDHFTHLTSASGTDLVSEFSAIQMTQAPASGKLKGIRAQKLHLENLPSGISSYPEDPVQTAPSRSLHQRSLFRKSLTPHHRSISNSKSHDNLRTPLRTPPPRPPRSPISPEFPHELPLRTSSRRASILVEPAATPSSTDLDGRIDGPAPMTSFSPPPTLPTARDEAQGYFSSRSASSSISTPPDQAWPLTAPLSGTFGVSLDDVEEEDEDETKRRSRVFPSNSASGLRLSRSFDGISRTSQDQGTGRPETRMSTTLGSSACVWSSSGPQKQPLSPSWQAPTDSWENDIDWCYENGLEGDCDYQWVEEATQSAPATRTPATLELQVQDDTRAYQGRIRASFLVPSCIDLPELSPASIDTMPSVQTPTDLLRPTHVRNHSHASTFKESHGFGLSPSLLIPCDFRSQMEEDDIYNAQFTDDGAFYLQQPYNYAISSVDGGESSTASYRSSNYSRDSARSSSSTRISDPHSRGSRDSAILLGSTEGHKEAHDSACSFTSIPEHEVSEVALSKTAHSADLSAQLAALQLKVTSYSAESEFLAEDPTTQGHDQSLYFETSVPSALASSIVPPSEASTGPAGITCMSEAPITHSLREHGRKISAPVVSPSVKGFKGRERSHTAASKRRGSYMLFPQI